MTGGPISRPALFDLLTFTVHTFPIREASKHQQCPMTASGADPEGVRWYSGGIVGGGGGAWVCVLLLRRIAVSPLAIGGGGESPMCFQHSLLRPGCQAWVKLGTVPE
jgi:hypothetical protein